VFGSVLNTACYQTSVPLNAHPNMFFAIVRHSLILFTFIADTAGTAESVK
jgi:hypothetical protein